MWPAGGGQPMAMGRRGPTRSSSAAAPSSSATTTAPSSASRQHSPWRQSPVPYLFGGLAAMLGLIALSLLALACSYWKLAGEADDAADHQARRAGDGEKGAADGTAGPAGDKWTEQVVVIMAGDEGPTFLATPASRRPDDGDAAASARGGGGSGSEQGRCVQCGARALPVAGVEDDALNRIESEQSAASSSSSIASSGTRCIQEHR